MLALEMDLAASAARADAASAASSSLTDQLAVAVAQHNNTKVRRLWAFPHFRVCTPRWGTWAYAGSAAEHVCPEASGIRCVCVNVCVCL